MENTGDGKNSMMEHDLQALLSTLISDHKRTQAALNIILRELAELKAKNNDLMGDGQTLSAEEIYQRFQQEIKQNV